MPLTPEVEGVAWNSILRRPLVAERSERRRAAFLVLTGSTELDDPEAVSRTLQILFAERRP